jgi:hypothetical protein
LTPPYRSLPEFSEFAVIDVAAACQRVQRLAREHVQHEFAAPNQALATYVGTLDGTDNVAVQGARGVRTLGSREMTLLTAENGQISIPGAIPN